MDGKNEEDDGDDDDDDVLETEARLLMVDSVRTAHPHIIFFISAI